MTRLCDWIRSNHVSRTRDEKQDREVASSLDVASSLSGGGPSSSQVRGAEDDGDLQGPSSGRGPSSEESFSPPSTQRGDSSDLGEVPNPRSAPILGVDDSSEPRRGDARMTTYEELLLKSPLVVDMRGELPTHKTKTWPTRDVSKLLGVVYHQSLDNYGTAHGNAKYHVGPNHLSSAGLPGLSYTFFADRELGKLVLANSLESAPYSQGDAKSSGDENALYLSVCFGGNFPGPGYDPPESMTLTSGQEWAATVGWTFFKKVFGFKDNQLFGHYHFGKPACPGYELTEIIEGIRKQYSGHPDERSFKSVNSRQSALRELGYYRGPSHNMWTTECRYALQRFQKSSALTSDGVWGPMTEARIIEALG